jgi:RHS repeat-associated protein
MVTLIRVLFTLALALFVLSLNRAQANTPPTLSSPDATPENALGARYHGALAGQAAVSAGGNASYSLAIDLPPGINGLKPQVSVNYNSNVRNGPLGLGWFLGGASASSITRCPQTISQNGTVHGVDFSPEDRFCLDGHQLVVVEGSYGDHWAVYRTETDRFARIESRDDAGGGPGWFIVRGKDGSIRHYGRQPDSRIEAEGIAQVRVWALDEVKDHTGNYYRLYYDENNAEGSYALRQIRYTGNENSGASPEHSIHFDYENRPDDTLHYRGGSKVRPHPRRLTAIRVAHNNEPLHEYRLEYEEVGVDSRSRLTRIAHCDSVGNCQDPIRVEWEDDGKPGYSSRSQLMPYTNMEGDLYGSAARSYTLNHGTSPRWHDMNGDGILDYVHVVPGTWGQYTGLNLDFEILLSGAEGYRTRTWSSALSSAPTGFTWADLNGDGMTDVLRPWGTGSNARLDVAFSTGEGLSMATWPMPARAGTAVYRDMNGDRLLDLVIRSRTRLQGSVGYWGVFVYLNEGDGFGAEQRWIDDRADGVELVDMNGDGLTDALWQDRYVYFNNGSGFGDEADFGSAGYQQKSVYLDYNGDGLPDRNTRASDGSCCVVELNTGRDFVDAGYTSRYAVLDIDRNGINDAFTRSNRQAYTDVDLFLAKDDHAGGYQRVRRTYKGNRDFFFQVADINGDGMSDFALAEQRVCRTWSEDGNTYIVYCEDDVHSVVESRSKPLQLVSRIVSGQGVETGFVYRPLTDHGIYTRGSGAVMPQVDVQDSTYVVTRFTQSDGIGGQFSTTYQYQGLRRDLGGRGHLGFARIIAKDLDADITTITDYAQSYPHASQPVRVDVIQSNSGHLITRSDITYDVRGTVGIGYVVFPYMAERSDYRYDPVYGDILATTTVSQEVDVFGNVLVSEELVTDHSLGNTFRSRTENSYHVDASWVWRPGQLASQTVRKWLNGSSDQPGGLTNAYYYDNATGLLLDSIRQPGGGAGIELTTTLIRDVSGNILSETLSGAGITARTRSFVYDTRQQFPIRASNPKGHLTQWHWDSRSGRKLSEVDGNGLVTLWEYDNFGRQLRETRPDGTSTSNRFYLDDSGQLAHSAYYLETVGTATGPVRVFYDQLGRQLRSRTQAFSGAYVNRDTEYDSKGRGFRTSEPYFEGESIAWNTRTFDLLGRVIALDAADSARSVSKQYRGFDTTITDALGRTTTRQLNAIGQVIATIDEHGTGLALVYDSQGNRVEATTAAMTPFQSSVRYSFDLLGRLLRQDDPNHGVYSYRYDALGQRLSEQSPDMAAVNQRVTYKYDTLGRVIRRLEPEGRTTWTYDHVKNGNLGKGQLYKEVQAGFTRSYLHDKSMHGRVSSVRTVIDGKSYNSTRTYDAAGRLSMERGPSSPLTGPGYAVYYRYNALGHMERVSEAGGGVIYQLLDTDAAGRATESWLGDGSITRYEYQEDSDRIMEQETVNGGSPIQHFAYHYDDLGNMSDRRNPINGLVESFDYDQLSRLTSWQVTGSVRRTAEFGPSGNIVGKSDLGPHYRYESPRVNAVTRIDRPAGKISLNYDPNGNLIDGAGMPSITWSSYNKPIRITRETVDYTFSYGPNRSRYRKERNGNVTHYVGGNFERNWLDTSEEYRHVVRANGRAIMVRRELAGGVTNLYLHRDHLGSITTVTRGKDGKVLERYSYDAWGKRRNASNWDTPVSSTAWMQRGYTGHEHLDDVGLIHMNGRIYDPGLGRMLSPDSVTQSPENGQNYNRYSYAFNNPLRFTDPSGNSTRTKNVCADACISSPAGAMEEVTVSAMNVSQAFVTGNTAALSFGMGQSAAAQLSRDVERHMFDQAEVLQLEQDVQSGAIVGKTADGDLVDGNGNAVGQFDYFAGNYDEWGAVTPLLVSALADITAAGFTATAIDGLVGGIFAFGLYYDSDTGSMGIYYSSGGGVNLVDGEIVAGFNLSVGFVGTSADSADAFFGESQSSSVVAIPLHPSGVGVTTSVATSSNGVALSGGISIGAGQGTSSVSTSKIVLY